MSELAQIVSSSMDYSLTWCEHQYVSPYFCDWRIDPCLVIVIYPPRDVHRLLVRYVDEKSFEVSNGEAFLVPAGVLHKFECPASEIIGVNVQYTIFDGIDILSFYNVPHKVTPKQAEGLKSVIDSLVAVKGQASWYAGESESKDDQLDLSRIVQERKFAFELLTKVLALSEIKPHGEQRLLLLQKLKPALEYIEDNLEQKIGIGNLADVCSLSNHRFSGLFKETMGDSPHQFILKRRMEKAMSLLSLTDLPVTEIANRLGFHDQPHFTKLFNAFTGLSPTYYRKDVWRRFAKEKI